MKKSYRNEKWYEFSSKVKSRDNFKCMECKRGQSEVVLQAHHTIYRENKLPWEYALSDCQTLCKGCHAREHGIIEPSSGWTLIAVEDLGELSGTCERLKCNSSIRYEHIIYRPKWGYKIVGSTCIDYLTEEDKELSSNILEIYKKVSNFISKNTWVNNITKSGNHFIETKYKYHIIKIYNNNERYSFTLDIKEKGKNFYDYGNFYNMKNKGLEETKELAFLALIGKISTDESEKILLRNIYLNIMKVSSSI